MYLYNLISQGENENLEFKFEVNDPRKIARTLVAFANTKGGRLLVGIKDNGVISGVFTDEEYYMVESGAKLYSRPEVDFQLHIHPAPNGKHVLEFIIEASKSKPHKVVAPGKSPEAYIRVRDENIIAHPVWVKVQEKLKAPSEIKYTDKHNKLLAYLKNKEAQTLETIMREVFISEKEAHKIIIDFIVSNIMKIETTNSGSVFKLK
ncbi:MAG: ATP-binding protein [Prevotellaceae bacterium]|jgi:predicted HTH transcriptional regulator|nr:ATP-binding protein [Prevotellaceae bacterium]